MTSCTCSSTTDIEGRKYAAQSQGPSSREEPKRPTFLHSACYDEVSTQFSGLVVISTFTATLIVSFLSLADQLFQIRGNAVREVGMWLALFACNIHLWVAIVSGRGAQLALTARLQQLSLNPPGNTPYRSMESGDFASFLVLSEQLQFTGSIIFGFASLMLIYQMFTSMWFAIALYIAASISLSFVFKAGFWKGSVLVGNFLKFVRVAQKKLAFGAR